MQHRLIKLLGVQCGAGGARAGAEEGPFALRSQGLGQRIADLGHRVEDLGDVPGIYQARFALTHGAVNQLPKLLQVNRHTHACVLGTRRKATEAFLLVIGGDHGLAVGTLAGLADSCRRLGILWIDAHADFNTPASSPSGNLHGMPLAIACGHGHRELRHLAGRDPMVREEDVFILGCRDIDADERDNLEHSRVNLFEMERWREQGVVAGVADAAKALAERCDHVHLSFDIDVFSPDVAPATGTPVPGGLSAAEGLAVMAELARIDCVHSAEFVEYNPKLDRENQTGELVISLVETLMGKAGEH